MFKRTFIWLFLIIIFANIALTETSHVSAVSKTPRLGQDILFKQIEPIEFPEDYPEDLLTFYDENIDARSYVVIDQETNKILAQGDANTPYPIASMTKVLSAYLILEAISEDKLSMKDKIEIPSEIVEGISSNLTLSNAWLEEGIEYPVEDLLHAVMLPSANDATSALMWEIYGDEQTAVQAMIDQLHEWNITNFALYSTSGAPNIDVPESFWMPGSSSMNQNMMSAADVALMTQHVIEEHPEILKISQTKEYVFMEGTDQEQIFVNPNQLLEGGNYARLNVTGLKSGYTDEAGKCFVATGSQQDRNYIAVAMGTFGEEMSSYWEIEILLDGLLEHPDLFKLELPTNLQEPALPDPALEEVEPTEEKETTTEMPEVENKRDNPITNFMRDVFNFFNW